jgi:hypothetical protein
MSTISTLDVLVSMLHVYGCCLSVLHEHAAWIQAHEHGLTGMDMDKDTDMYTDTTKEMDIDMGTYTPMDTGMDMETVKDLETVMDVDMDTDMEIDMDMDLDMDMEIDMDMDMGMDIRHRTKDNKPRPSLYRCANCKMYEIKK